MLVTTNDPTKRFRFYRRRWHYGNGAVVGENWRFCNDRPECLETVRAKPKTLITLYGLSSTVRLVESTSDE